MRWNEGDKTELENYRPVTCLPAAAKLLEKVACEQTSKYRLLLLLLSPASKASRGVYDPCLN